MTTVKLYEFLVLSKLLNYSKAAQALYISQSVLTKHIQSLEKELGVMLFNRTTHGVALTEAGRIFAKEVPNLIDKCDSTMRRLRSRNIPAKGTIKIGIGVEFSYSNHIKKFIHSFMERYPDIELKYDVISDNTPCNVASQYDLFFTPCLYHDLPENMTCVFSRHHGTYVILPPGHELMSKSTILLRQLTDETIIVPHADEFFGPYAQNRILAEKATRGQISIIKVDNLATALFLVTMGKGICIAPLYAKNMMPAESFLLSISDTKCSFDEYLYYCETGNGAAKIFFEEFKATIPTTEKSSKK